MQTAKAALSHQNSDAECTGRLFSRRRRRDEGRHTMFTDVTLPKHDTWGASLQAYAKDRTTPAWGDAPVPPKDKRQTHYDKSRLERDYNPILMEHRNPTVERARKMHDQEYSLRRLNAARDKQLCYEQSFNIVNHQPQVPGVDVPVAQAHHLREQITRPPDSRVAYNILSHLPHSDHKAGNVGVFSFDEGMRPAPNQPRLLEGGMLPASWNQREFNVVSNRYHKSHADRERDDRATLKHEAQVRYWQTHNYDPVVGRYYDNTKEEEFHRQRKSLEKVQGSCQIARLPPSIQYCEGTAYNVITHDIKDDHKLSIASGIGNRSMKSKRGSTVEAGIHARAHENEQLYKTRVMNKISRTGEMREREDGRHHGYDPITNESHRGREAREMAASRLQKAEQPWMKLKSTDGTKCYSTTASATMINGSSSAQPARRPREPAATAARPATEQAVASAPSAAAPARPSVPALNIPSSDAPQVRTGGFS